MVGSPTGSDVAGFFAMVVKKQVALAGTEKPA
jgi:hypothetical protein